MTQEAFEAKQAAMTNKELIELVEKQISELARSGGKSHRMCVPPMITDTDMLLSEMVKRFKKYSQSIGMAYMPTTIDEMELKVPVFHKTPVPEFEGLTNTGYSKGDWLKMNMDGAAKQFPLDPGYYQWENMKNKPKNPLFTDPKDWMPEIGQQYWTVYKPARTVKGPFVAENPNDLDRNDFRYFPSWQMAQEYLKTIREKKEERWKPEFGLKFWAVNLVEDKVIEFINNQDFISTICVNMGNCFPTEQAALTAKDIIKELLSSVPNNA